MHEEKQEPAKQTEPPAAAQAPPLAETAPPVPQTAEPTSPAAFAEQLRASPASMPQVLERLHHTHGNAFVQQVLAELGQSSGGGGKPLPPTTRAKMEQAFGTDLSAVRVHQDGTAEATGSEAYTRGTV